MNKKKKKEKIDTNLKFGCCSVSPVESLQRRFLLTETMSGHFERNWLKLLRQVLLHIAE